MKVLNLTNNLLTQIEDTFGGLPALEQLDLSNNTISSIAIGALDSLAGSLRSLNLSGNPNLTDLPAAALLPLKPVRSLCLAGVPVHCCGLEPFRDSGTIDDNCEGVTICASPASVAGQALSATKGLLCGEPPKRSSKNKSRTTLAAIAGSVGAIALILLVVFLVRYSRRSGSSAALNRDIGNKTDERSSLIAQRNVVFEDA